MNSKLRVVEVLHGDSLVTPVVTRVPFLFLEKNKISMLANIIRLE